jgi:hypothetical protein
MPSRSGWLSIPTLNATGSKYQYVDGTESRDSCSAALSAAMV